jgi:hypothetical protein
MILSFVFLFILLRHWSEWYLWRGSKVLSRGKHWFLHPSFLWVLNWDLVRTFLEFLICVMILIIQLLSNFWKRTLGNCWWHRFNKVPRYLVNLLLKLNLLELARLNTHEFLCYHLIDVSICILSLFFRLLNHHSFHFFSGVTCYGLFEDIALLFCAWSLGFSISLTIGVFFIGLEPFQLRELVLFLKLELEAS